MPRGNPQNLDKLTTEEAQKRGRNGGIKSGIARRKKRDMKTLCEMIGTSQNNSAKAKTIAKQLGLDLDEITFDFMAVFMQYQKAINEKDTRAIEFIRDTLGQKPANQVEVKNNDYEDLTPLATMLKLDDSEVTEVEGEEDE